MVYICTKFPKNTCILKGFRFMERTQFLYYYKRHNSVKIVLGFIVFVLCKLSNHGQHFVPSLAKKKLSGLRVMKRTGFQK